MKDYLSQMLYALTSAYTQKDYDNIKRGLAVETNIGKLFSIFAWGLDSVQEQAELVRLWDDLDYACGSVLDRYGANFGVKRFGATDSFYRLTIKVKLLSQLSGGDIDTVLNAAASLFSIPVEKVELAEIFPAKIGITVNEADLTPETLAIVVEIVEMIKRILAAGVGIITTLRSYRDFEGQVPIGTALFEHSLVTFGLDDARHTAAEGNLVASAAFERSSLAFGLFDVQRAFTEAAPVEAALFERTQVRTEPVPPEPQVFHSAASSAFILFEHSRINIKPCY